MRPKRSDDARDHRALPTMRLPARTSLCANVTVLAAAVSSVACSRRATPSECNALLDRYVELLVEQRNPRTPASEIARLRDLARAQASANPAFLRCPQKVAAREAACALAAPNADELRMALKGIRSAGAGILG